MWVMNLGHLGDLDKPEFEQEKKLMWSQIETSGPSPGALAHHSSVVFNDRMYLFGGSSSNGAENQKFYSLDLKTFKWEIIDNVSKVSLYSLIEAWLALEQR